MEYCKHCQKILVAQQEKYCSKACCKKYNHKHSLASKIYRREISRVRSRGIERERKLDVTWRDIYRFYASCPKGMVVDHIIPLHHDAVCGLHIPNNFQYLSKKDNRKKANSFDGTVDNEKWKV